MTADVAKEAEGENLSHILARMAIRKALRKHMYAKKFGDAVKDVMKDHNLSINLEASQQQHDTHGRHAKIFRTQHSNASSSWRQRSAYAA